MDKFIPLSTTNLNGNEKKYILDTLNTELISTSGEYITKFENSIAKYLNTTSAVACQSGTAALHLALLASGISNKDAVIVPTLSYISSVNPIKYVGAEPIFMDCDDSLTLDPKKLLEFCDKNCLMIYGRLAHIKSKRRIKALIVSHTYGNLANMEEIMDIANTFNLVVIEDASSALGSKFTSGKFENCYAGSIGNIGVLSFNSSKIITSGSGGMLVSNDIDLLKKSLYLSTQAKDDSLRYIHNDIGYNYRMTNLHAALGLAQLENLDAFIRVKRENFNYYKENLENIGSLSLLSYRKNTIPNYESCLLLIDKFPLNRDKLIDYLFSHNIETRPIWDLIHKQKPYINSEIYKINKAYYYLDNIIRLPSGTNITKEDINYICEILFDGLRIYGRDI